MDVSTISAMRAYARTPMPNPVDPQAAIRSMASNTIEETAPSSFMAQSAAAMEAHYKKRDFASTMRASAMEAIDSLHKAEDTSLQSLDGKGDVLQLMRAMSDAEMTLRTVSAVRDKVVEAYQEIMRMPI